MFSAASGNKFLAVPSRHLSRFYSGFSIIVSNFLGQLKNFEEKGRQILVNKIEDFCAKKMVEIPPLEIFHPTYVLAILVSRVRPLPWGLVHDFEKE
jgi:hypothetical protein